MAGISNGHLRALAAVMNGGPGLVIATRTVASACLIVLLSALPAAAQPASLAPPDKVPPGGGAATALMWDEVDPSRFERAVIGDVAGAPAGQFVITGYDPWKKTRARAFRSKDGGLWKARGLPGGNRWPNGVTNVSPVAVTTTATRLFALGQDRISRPGLSPKPNGVVWRSRTGADWQHIATINNALVADIVAGPDGLHVAGERVTRDGTRTPTVWASSDGKVWRRQRLDRDGPPPASIAVADDGVQLVIGHKIRNDLRTWTRLWRSEDGVAWSRIELPGSLGEDDRIRIHGPVATATGFLLFVGEHDRGVETLWRSDTGLEWDQVPLPEDWALSRSWVIAQPWPRRSLVIEARTFPASSRQPSLLLTSDGGLTWCRSDGPRVVPFTAFDVTAGRDQSLLMVGSAGLRPVVWSVRWTQETQRGAAGAEFPCLALPIGDVIDQRTVEAAAASRSPGR